MREKILVYLSAVVMGVAVFNFPLQAQTGSSLYSKKCMSCHRDVSRISASSDELKKILQTGSVKIHRFTLSEEEIQLIVDFIDGNRK